MERSNTNHTVIPFGEFRVDTEGKVLFAEALGDARVMAHRGHFPPVLEGCKLENLRAITMQGEEMTPTGIFAGATLIVDVGDKRPQNGRVFVIRNGDAVLVRRLQWLRLLHFSQWAARGDNGFQTPSIEPFEPANVIGRVVYVMGKPYEINYDGK